MDINNLSGKELDEYGKSQGVERYQGIGRPESDDQYRQSILDYKNKQTNKKSSCGSGSCGSGSCGASGDELIQVGTSVSTKMFGVVHKFHSSKEYKICWHKGQALIFTSQKEAEEAKTTHFLDGDTYSVRPIHSLNMVKS